MIVRLVVIWVLACSLPCATPDWDLYVRQRSYRRSFFDVLEDEEGPFEGLVHVEDWVPQRLVTATGANPLPR